MSDLLHQNLATVQSDKQPKPGSIVAAAAISPTNKFSFISGTTQIANITPPVSGYCELTLCFTNAAPGLLLTTGNIQFAYQPIINRPFDLCWVNNKWYVKATV